MEGGNAGEGKDRRGRLATTLGARAFQSKGGLTTRRDRRRTDAAARGRDGMGKPQAATVMSGSDLRVVVDCGRRFTGPPRSATTEAPHFTFGARAYWGLLVWGARPGNWGPSRPGGAQRVDRVGGDARCAMGMGNGRAGDGPTDRPMRAVAATLATPGQPRAHSNSLRLVLLHDPGADHRDDLRDDGIAEASQAVHSAGNPMSHSTHVGFSAPPAAAGRHGVFLLKSAGPTVRKSRAVGVGHIVNARNISVRFIPELRKPLHARGVGSNEPNPLAPMGCSGMESTHHDRPVGVAERFQVREHPVSRKASDARNVLSDNPSRSAFADEPGELRPQVALVCGAATLAGETEGLAREAAADEVWGWDAVAAKRGSVKASHVRIYRRIRPMLAEHGDGIRFALAERDGAHPDAFEAEGKTTDAAEEVEDMHLHRLRLAQAVDLGAQAAAFVLQRGDAALVRGGVHRLGRGEAPRDQFSRRHRALPVIQPAIDHRDRRIAKRPAAVGARARARPRLPERLLRLGHAPASAATFSADAGASGWRVACSASSVMPAA